MILQHSHSLSEIYTAPNARHNCFSYSIFSARHRQIAPSFLRLKVRVQKLKQSMTMYVGSIVFANQPIQFANFSFPPSPFLLSGQLIAALWLGFCSIHPLFISRNHRRSFFENISFLFTQHFNSPKIARKDCRIDCSKLNSHFKLQIYLATNYEKSMREEN